MVQDLTAKEFKAQLTNKLNELANGYGDNDYLSIGLAINVSYLTVKRYTSGNIIEVRRLELADAIVAACTEHNKTKK